MNQKEVVISKARILVVEDERIVARDIEQRLTGLGYAIAGSASTGQKAIEKAQTNSPDIVLMDIRLHGSMDGIETAEIIKDRFDIPVIYLTAYGSDGIIERAKVTEPFGYVMKPFEDKELHIVIEIALFRHKMERKFRESEKRYKRIFEGSRDALFVLDGDGYLTDFNSAFLSLFGSSHEEAIGRKLGEYCLIDDDEAMINDVILHGGPLVDREMELATNTGETIHCLVTVSFTSNHDNLPGVCYLGSIHDITKRKKLEADLLHAQKMEMLGTFASKVAHDFNNVLTALLGYGRLIAMKMEGNATVSDYANKILALCETATSFTQSLLTFSRKNGDYHRIIPLNDTIERYQRLRAEVMGEGIFLNTRLADDELNICADSGEIEQILTNLVSNARDAMPDGGTITISTRKAGMEDEYLKEHVAAVFGDFACVEIMDEGYGMDQDVVKRVFEPFYTTKDVGKGTGLGLAIVYGIVKQLNGYIQVESEIGSGTTFKIYFPLVGCR